MKRFKQINSYYYYIIIKFILWKYMQFVDEHKNFEVFDFVYNC